MIPYSEVILLSPRGQVLNLLSPKVEIVLNGSHAFRLLLVHTIRGTLR